MRRGKRALAVLAIISLVILGVGTPGLAMQGAIWTSDIAGNVNINQYASKADVYLNGGPQGGGGPGLPDGDYWCQVTSPNGVTLGKSTYAVIHVVGGKFDRTQLITLVKSHSSAYTADGFDDSPNGEYKVWVGTDQDFSEHKTDNFKVVETPPTPGSITVKKYSTETEALMDGATFELYLDSNDNGIPESGEKVAGPTGTTGGVLVFGGLAAGKYLVVEASPPTYHSGDPDSPKTVTLLVVGNAVENLIVEFWNTPIPPTPGSITVQKYSTATEALMDGATFELYLDSNDNGVAEPGEKVAGPTGTTGGVVVFGGLAAGKYLVVEASPPAYHSGDPGSPKAVTLLVVDNAVQNLTVSFYNTPLPPSPGTITVEKYSNGDPPTLIDGATFQLYLDADLDGVADSGEEYGGVVGTTGGIAQWTGLSAGQYLVKEVSPPLYHSGDPGSPKVVVLTVVDYVVTSATVEFYNDPIPPTPGSITVKKYSTATDTLMDGATFELYLDSNDNGIAEPGEWVAGPTGTTGGVVVFGGLAAGKYLVVEASPPTYYSGDPGSPRTVTLAVVANAVQNLTVNFYNDPIPPTPGSITVEKYSWQTEGLIDGATFALYLDSNDNGIPEPGEKVAGPTGTSGGVVVFGGLAAGKYLVVETTPPANHTGDPLSPKAVTLLVVDNAVQNLTVQFWNEPIPPGYGTITVYKHSGEGPTAPLIDGAQFQLYLDVDLNGPEPGEECGPAKGTSGGVAMWVGLNVGVYWVVEITPPPFHYVSPGGAQQAELIFDIDTYTVTSAELHFYNPPVPPTPGSITVEKYSTATEALMDGATFELYLDANDNGVAEPGEKVAGPTGTTGGVVVFGGLAAGKYLVKEVSPPLYHNGDPGNPKTVTLLVVDNAVQNLTVEFWNTPIPPTPGSITVRKYSTATEALMDGATFELYLDSNDNGVAEPGEKVAGPTGTTGGVVVFGGLAAGKYLVVEASPPTYHSGDPGSPKLVTLVVVGNAVQNLTVNFYNDLIPPTPGSITVEKYSTATEALLDGATFELYLDSNDNGVPEPGEKVAGPTGTAGGVVVFGGLGAGKYLVVEATPPANHSGDPGSPKTVTLLVVGNAVQNLTVEFWNTPLPPTPGSITVNKTNNASPPAGLTGATFSLYAGTDTSGTPLSTVTLSGSSYTWSGLAAGTYTVVEVTAPPGHNKAVPDYQTVTLIQSGITVSSATVTFVNTPLPPPPPPTPGSITVYKYDAGTSVLIDGATFSLYLDVNSNGIPETAEKMSGPSGTTGGVLQFTGLWAGKYLVVEATPPTGYNGDVTAVKPVTLLSLGLTVESKSVEFYNTRIMTPGSITVNKYDAESSGLIDGAQFSLYLDANDNGVADAGELQAGPVDTSAGTYTFSGLGAGKYLVVEVTPPAGYLADSPAVKGAVLTETDSVVSSATVDFYNTAKYTPGSITVVKLDIEGGPLSGATFTLSKGASVVGTVTMTTNTHTWSTLGEGTYTVSEVTPPVDSASGRSYTAVTGPQTVTLVKTWTADGWVVSSETVTFENELPGTGFAYLPWAGTGAMMMLAGLVIGKKRSRH